MQWGCTRFLFCYFNYFNCNTRSRAGNPASSFNSLFTDVNHSKFWLQIEDIMGRLILGLKPLRVHKIECKDTIHG